MINSSWDGVGSEQVQSKDATEHPTVYRTDPPLKSYLAKMSVFLKLETVDVD